MSTIARVYMQLAEQGVLVRLSDAEPVGKVLAGAIVATLFLLLVLTA